jgi:hypothetical protein
MYNANSPTDSDLPTTAQLVKSTIVAAEQRQEGVIVAAFNGQHGWFWRNRTSQTITVTLQTVGEYTDIKHLK